MAEPEATPIARVVAGRALGFAARATGDLAGAAGHFAAARTAAASIGASSFERELSGFEASVLDLRGEHDTALQRAREVAEASDAAGDRITEAWARLVGATALVRVERWEEARVELARGAQAIDALEYPWFDGAMLRMQAASTACIRDLKVLGDLARLLARPDEEIHCLELAGGADVGGDAGPALDDRARRDYQRRITELQEEIDEATAHNDIGRAERAEVELDTLVGQLTEAFGLGGRARPTGSATERARSAVTYRVRAAVKRIAEVHPELGRHLGNSIRTGTWCAYRPETDVVWELGPG